MTNTRSNSEYKSPKHKLIRFFEKSRNEWKIKAQNAKIALKKLTNRISFLEKSRSNWKVKAKKFEYDLKKMQHQNASLQEEIKTLKKSH